MKTIEEEKALTHAEFETKKAAMKKEFEKLAKEHGEELTLEQQKIIKVTALKMNLGKIRSDISELSEKIAEAQKAIKEQEEISAILREMIEELENEQP